MEGLEIVEVEYNNLEIENDILRLDSEFFNKEAVSIHKMMIKAPHYFIDKSNVVSGPFGSSLKSDSYLSQGVPFVRIENIKGGFYIDDSSMIYISSYDNERLKNSILYTDDIILSKVGNSIGYFARVDDSMTMCNISENNIGIKLCDIESRQQKHFILTYLNSYFAQQLVLRRRSGNAQPKLNVGDLSYIPIPCVSDYFMQEISTCIISANVHKQSSIQAMSIAETILLNEFDLNDWQPTKETTTEKCFTDFLHSGRLDAEYYQPKYDELFEHLSKYETKRLGKIAVISKSVEPGSDAYQSEGVPFIRVSNLSKYGLSQPDIYLDALEFGADEVIRPRKDTILLSKDGSVGIAYKVQEDMNSITSGAILHLNLRDDEFLPDYVTLVLNSIIVKMQAERDAGGSIIQHWKPSEIEQVIIPKLSMAKQREITAKIQESFALRAESKRLLDLAKRAVEVAIEQGEDEGLKLLNQK